MKEFTYISTLDIYIIKYYIVDIYIYGKLTPSPQKKEEN